MIYCSYVGHYDQTIKNKVGSSLAKLNGTYVHMHLLFSLENINCFLTRRSSPERRNLYVDTGILQFCSQITRPHDQVAATIK